MKTRSLLFLLLMTISSFVFAQTYTFKVLVNKGRNEMKSGSAWQAIKVGSSLKENDEIKVGSNAYVGLVHASGKPIELKEPKTYKVADLAKQFSGGPSVVAKYTDFILSSNEDKKNKLAATGAVHRGLGELNVYLPTIPEQTFFFNDAQLLGWDNSQIKGPYRVTFTSLFDDELKVVNTTENFVLVDLKGNEFQNEDNVLVTVHSESEPKGSHKFTLNRLSKADHARIKSALDSEVGATANEENALAKSILAAFFENNKLLIDAATAYKQAAQLAPEVSVYQENYNEFISRAGLKSEPKK